MTQGAATPPEMPPDERLAEAARRLVSDPRERAAVGQLMRAAYAAGLADTALMAATAALKLEAEIVDEAGAARPMAELLAEAEDRGVTRMANALEAAATRHEQDNRGAAAQHIRKAIEESLDRLARGTA